MHVVSYMQFDDGMHDVLYHAQELVVDYNSGMSLDDDVSELHAALARAGFDIESRIQQAVRDRAPLDNLRRKLDEALRGQQSFDFEVVQEGWGSVGTHWKVTFRADQARRAQGVYLPFQSLPVTHAGYPVYYQFDTPRR